MDWTYLGHAMWLVEAAGLRLLCDPLLAASHHCGVFEVVPQREVDAAALRADFILVSHRHPDHFDVASLDRLAQIDPDAVVVTPDALVCAVATRLGFRSVQQVAPGSTIELDGVRLVTTPSIDPREWGVMIGCDGAAAWNQVDTVLEGPRDVARVRDAALAALGAPHVGFAAVRWQPMLEIAAQLGEPTRFPMRQYDRVLRDIAAIEARAIMPASAGGSHRGPFAWLDRVVFPVPEARLLRDLAALCPDAALFASDVGTTWRIDANGCVANPRGGDMLVRVDAGNDPRTFAPFSIPTLVDPNPSGTDVATMRTAVHRWLHTDLCEGLARGLEELTTSRPLSLVVEVVWPDDTESFTFTAQPGSAHVRRGGHDDWDACNQVAGSLLWEVVTGRRGWGDVLLAGALRGRVRAYRITAGGAQALPLAETFLYYGLDYDASHERAVWWEVEQALARRPR
jgi:hypothetical protein